MTSPSSPGRRLSSATLRTAGAGVRRPGYDRARLSAGIVHIGLGAFARAHICEYTEDALEREPGPWGIVGVSLRRPDQRDRLGPQDGLYTLLSRDAGGDRARILGSVQRVLVGAGQMTETLAVMRAPGTRVVSLTVTEKGYCHDPASGRLAENHPDIRHDLEHPHAPRSAPGLIVAALAQRRSAGLAPFTVLCCDNLPHNGRLVAGLVRDLAALRDEKLAAWIDANGAFPSTMVDRIVPAMVEEDLAAAERLTGLLDAAPVAHEPFRQWVIEDRFVDGRRPAWEQAGAELVADVAPFETMKLRLLNGSHSALAYLGYLGGHETIGDCAADPVYRAFTEALWREEIIPVTPPPPGTDLARYAGSLMKRYDNPRIRHRTWQIAMDGSQKLPQRLLATVRLRLARGLSMPRLALAIAAWMIYAGGVDEAGNAIDVRDPLAQTIRRALDGAGPDPDAQVAALIGLDAIFGSDLPSDPVFRTAVASAYARLRSDGVRRTLAAAAG